MIDYSTGAHYKQNSSSWYSPLTSGRCPSGWTLNGTNKYEARFAFNFNAIRDYNVANYIVSARFYYQVTSEYGSKTQTLKITNSSGGIIASGSSGTSNPSGWAYITLSTAMCNGLVDGSAMYVNTYGASNNTYCEVYGTGDNRPYLDITWASRNTAPYWPSGSTLSVSGAINGGYCQAGSTLTASWPICSDDQGNLSYYNYAISSDNGAHYVFGTTGNRSITYSDSMEGAQIIFAVQGVGSGGLGSGWIYSSMIRVNFSPSAPSINTIAGSAPSQNMTIPYNASMVLGASSHDGGLASGYSAVNYRQTGTYTGSYGTGTTIGLINLMNSVGSTASISAQASDGWATATSTAYTVRVGASLAAPSLTLSKAYLDSSTNITIGSCLIDGAYYSSGIEWLRIQCNINSAGWVDLWTGSRKYSSRTTANNVTVTNLLQRLFNLNSGFVGANATVQFRADAFTGHLESAAGETVSVSYTSAKFVTSPAGATSITHADDSTTFKYPMNNQIPVTEVSFTVSFGATKDANFSDAVTATLYSRVGAGSWTARGTRSITTTSYSSTFAINFADISVTRGQTISLKIELTSVANGATILHASIEPSWNDGGSTKSIEFRAFPSFSASIIAQQSSFIRNGFSNGVAATLRLTTDVNKAYYIHSSIAIGAYYSGNDASVASIYDIVYPTHDYNAQVVISDTIEANKSWDIVSAKILGSAWNIGANYIPSNLNITVTYTFTIREAYKSSKDGSTPIAWEDDFSSRASSSTSVNQSTNSFCKPEFTSGNITFVRQ